MGILKSVLLSIILAIALLSSLNLCCNLQLNITKEEYDICNYAKNQDAIIMPIKQKTCNNIMNPNRKRTC